MNDRDWFKKRRRGKKGGCAWLLLAVAAAVVLLAYLPAYHGPVRSNVPSRRFIPGLSSLR
jgi:hypothetical protein